MQQIFCYAQYLDAQVSAEDTEMSRRNKIFKTGIILMVLSCVSACGQKGPLYHPPETSSLSTISILDTA